jgi:hypothetical protein
MAIEDFLTADCCESDWVRKRKLTEVERVGLEGEVTMQELSDALDNSNFNSASRWDGLSFKVLRIYWEIVGPLMLKMAKETFRCGELTETFKVRSMEGKGIDECEFINRAVGRLDIEKLTAEAYADDSTLIFKMSERAIEVVLAVLNEFKLVSGLSVNTNKTQLMVCGIDAWEIGDKIHGIEVVDSIRVLGIYIDRKLTNLDRNWDEAVIKMRRYCFFWGNFGLSISGRLMAAKTYILSQAIYLMGVLPLTDETGVEINEIIANYVKGRGRILERSRQTICEELGGYGIIDLRVLNKSVKSTWIKRWYEESKIYDYPMVYMH